MNNVPVVPSSDASLSNDSSPMDLHFDSPAASSFGVRVGEWGEDIDAVRMGRGCFANGFRVALALCRRSLPLLRAEKTGVR